MTESEILQKLTVVLRDVFDLPDLVLKNSTTAQDIDEWDSVNHIMLLVETERQFKVKFQTAEVEEMKNVGDLVSMIRVKLVEK